MANKSIIGAVAGCKCPRCREGNMFKDKLLSIKFMQMNENCPKCGFKFEIEPSFFQGAMYVSYAFSVGLFVIVFALTTIFLDKPGIEIYMTNIIVAIILLIPVSFRYSRVIFMYTFGGIDYEPHIK